MKPHHFLLTGEGGVMAQQSDIVQCVDKRIVKSLIEGCKSKHAVATCQSVRNSLQYPMPFIEAVECAVERWCFLIASLRCAQATLSPSTSRAEAVEERLNLVRCTRRIV